jgi:hypothetical protein
VACLCPRKGEALPGYWVVLLIRAVVRDPAERAALLPPGENVAAAFRNHDSLGAREPPVSGLHPHGPYPRVPTHHPECIAAPRARLATGLLGSALTGQALHLLDDFSDFPESPHDSLLSDQPCLVAP